jgi:hypothetical protein
MPVLSRVFNWGVRIKDMGDDLYNQLSKAYTDTANVVNTKVSKRVIADQDPPASDQVNKNYDIGDVWVRTSSDRAWMMTSRTSDIAVTWTEIT